MKRTILRGLSSLLKSWSFGCSWSRRGAKNMTLVLCRVCANQPLVAPPKGALFATAEKTHEAASVAKR